MFKVSALLYRIARQKKTQYTTKVLYKLLALFYHNNIKKFTKE